MQSYEVALVEDAFSQMRTVSISSEEQQNSDGLRDLLDQHQLMYVAINLSDMTATGFTADGLLAIQDLARKLRAQAQGATRLASNQTVAKMIAARMIELFRGKNVGSLTNEDFLALEDAINGWLRSLAHTRRHVVPCVFTSYPLGSIDVGPVTLHHRTQFPWEEFGGEPQSPPSSSFDLLIRLADERMARWFAVAKISGMAVEESVRAADVAVDIALSAIQLALPFAELRYVARATGRTVPIWRATVWQGDGIVHNGVANQEPGRGIDGLDVAMKQVSPLLESMGRRLSNYLNATSALPDLDEAWCNAAYWYHEALAETHETISVAKLETAIEILFRSESMSGSKRRLLDAFEAIFGLTKTDKVPGSEVTVDQFATAITTARSRVLHGTWPTLTYDLPGAKGIASVTFSDVNILARLLLVNFSLGIDAYLNAGNTAGEADAFIDWLNAERNKA